MKRFVGLLVFVGVVVGALAAGWWWSRRDASTLVPVPGNSTVTSKLVMETQAAGLLVEENTEATEGFGYWAERFGLDDLGEVNTVVVSWVKKPASELTARLTTFNTRVMGPEGQVLYAVGDVAKEGNHISFGVYVADEFVAVAGERELERELNTLIFKGLIIAIQGQDSDQLYSEKSQATLRDLNKSEVYPFRIKQLSQQSSIWFDLNLVDWWEEIGLVREVQAQTPCCDLGYWHEYKECTDTGETCITDIDCSPATCEVTATACQRLANNVAYSCNIGAGLCCFGGCKCSSNEPTPTGGLPPPPPPPNREAGQVWLRLDEDLSNSTGDPQGTDQSEPIIYTTNHCNTGYPTVLIPGFTANQRRMSYDTPPDGNVDVSHPFTVDCLPPDVFHDFVSSYAVVDIPSVWFDLTATGRQYVWATTPPGFTITGGSVKEEDNSVGDNDCPGGLVDYVVNGQNIKVAQCTDLQNWENMEAEFYVRPDPPKAQCMVDMPYGQTGVSISYYSGFDVGGKGYFVRSNCGDSGRIYSSTFIHTGLAAGTVCQYEVGTYTADGDLVWLDTPFTPDALPPRRSNL